MKSISSMVCASDSGSSSLSSSSSYSDQGLDKLVWPANGVVGTEAANLLALCSFFAYK